MPRIKKAKKSDPVSEEFKEIIAAMQTLELKDRVVQLSKQEGEILKAKAEDEQLAEAAETFKQYRLPYSDAVKRVRAERRYVHGVLEERGQ